MLQRIKLGTFLFVVTFSSVAAAEVIHVDASAMGNCDGTSWADAFTDLQDGLLLAQSGDEIWVAAGTYKPDRGSGDRFMSFELKGGVTLFGGFAGWETASFQRFPEINRSILSGDLNSDDDPNGSTRAGTSNCCTGHDSPGCDDAACEQFVCDVLGLNNVCCLENGLNTWDSLVCGGRARAYCCSLCNTKNNCENSLTVVKLTGNNEETTLDGLTIIAGNSDFFSPLGGDERGGGVEVENGIIAIRNCVFHDNAAADGGGGLYTPRSVITLENSVFYKNETVFGGAGAMLCERCSGTVTNSRFVNGVDSLGYGGVVFFVDNEPLIVRNCVFENNHLFFNPAVGAGGNLGPVMIDCVFRNNTNQLLRGGGLSNGGSSTTLINCLFEGNQAWFSGAIENNVAGLRLINTVVNNNVNLSSFSTPGGLNNFIGVAAVRNCTFTNNVGGGIVSDIGQVSIKSSILWGNSLGDGEVSLYGQVFDGREGIISIDYSDVQFLDGQFTGVGNTNVDPLFVDLQGPGGIPGSANNNLRLSALSPLINKGDPMPDLSAFADLDGHTRKLCGRLDMGAYEFGIGDFDCNQTVNLTDFANWAACMTEPNDATASAACQAFDFDADDDIDLSDLAAFSNTLARSP